MSRKCSRPECPNHVAGSWPHAYCPQCLDKHGRTCPTCGALAPRAFNGALEARDCMFCRKENGR